MSKKFKKALAFIATAAMAFSATSVLPYSTSGSILNVAATGETENTKIYDYTDDEHTHKLIYVDEVPATCTKTGTKAHFVCNEHEDSSVTPHKLYEVPNAFTKNMTQEQFTTMVNASTNLTETDEDKLKIDINESNHTIKHVVSKDAQCEESGNIEYYYCENGCENNKYYSDASLSKEITDSVNISALGHKLAEDGETCTACNMKLDEIKIAEVQLKAAKASLTAMQSNLTAAKTAESDLEKQLSDLETQIKNVQDAQDELKSLNDSLSALQDIATSAEESKNKSAEATLNAGKALLEATENYEKAQADLATLKEGDEGYTEAVENEKSAKDAVTKAQTAYNSANSKYDVAYNMAEIANERVTSMQNRIKAYEQLTKEEQKTTDLKQLIDELNTTKIDLTTQLTKAQEATTTAQTAVDDAQQAVTDTQDKLNALKEATTLKVVGMSLNLDVEKIGVNIYLTGTPASEDKLTFNGEILTAGDSVNVMLSGKETECKVYTVNVTPNNFDEKIIVRNNRLKLAEASVTDYIEASKTYFEAGSTAQVLVDAMTEYCKVAKAYLTTAKFASASTYVTATTAESVKEKYVGSSVILGENSLVKVREYFNIGTADEPEYAYTEKNPSVLGAIESIEIGFNKKTLKDYFTKLGESTDAGKVGKALVAYDTAARNYNDNPDTKAPAVSSET